MPLTIEQVNGLTRREMENYIQTHKLSSIDVFGIQIDSLICKLQKSELHEIILGIPHARNENNPSWYDLFISICEQGIIITIDVTKRQMRKLSSNFNALRDSEQSPSWINLRILASRYGYVKDNCRTNIKSHDLCEILGLPCIEYGYQREVMLLAKYFRFGSAERLPSRFSFDFLGMQPYPKTINELADVDEERFNHDVIIARECLKAVIHLMRRTKLVKLILAKYSGDRYSTNMTSAELVVLLQ